MKTLDRYIVRMFLVNFVILLTVLMALVIMIDLVLQMDEFIGAAEKAKGSGGMVVALGWTVVQFYGPFIPLLYVFLSGLVTVAAMGFTFVAMSRAGELVAMVASGVSMYRIAAPVLIVGSILSALTLVNQELVIPPLAPLLLRKHSDLGSNSAKDFAVVMLPDASGALFSGRFSADPSAYRLQPVTILVRDEKGRTVRRISGSQAFWDKDKHGWTLNSAYELTWLRAVGNGQGASGSTGSGRVEFFKTNLSPEIILAKHAALYSRLLSLADLRQLLRNPNINQGEVVKIMHSRFSMLVMNVLILAMGFPFFLLREPTNMLVQVVTAACVCLGTWFVGLVVLQIPADQLNPVTTAWLPVASYLVLSAFLMLRIKT